MTSPCMHSAVSYSIRYINLYMYIVFRYAASPENFEFMLDRMVGSHGDDVCDDIMRISSCVSGNYWYFPSNQQLKLLVTS